VAVDTRQQIIDQVQAYNQRVTQIREDLTLSPLGRRRALEQLYTGTRDQVTRLRATLDADTHGSRRTLERRLFGLPATATAVDVVSYRDATDRVAAVKSPEELGELMERAAGTGDAMLVRAGFARAWRESRQPMSSDMWAGLVNEYLDQNPAAVRDAEQLAELTSPRGRTHEFAERVAMTVTRPRELDASEDALSDQAPVRSRPETLIR
jgi:Xaa-Pro aminopeptidase